MGEEVEKFVDRVGVRDHDRFQRWRQDHPDGFFLNVKSKTSFILHKVNCLHSGDPTWDGKNKNGEIVGSLTKAMKYCSESAQALRDKAREFGTEAIPCDDCQP